MRKSWVIKRLGDLSEVITKGTTPTSVGYDFVDNGINFVKVESINGGGQFLPEKLAKISEKCHLALKRSQLQEGDILFSIAGALGRTALVTEDILPANTNQALSIIRLKKSDDVLTEFILKALETGIVFEQIEKFRGGVAQQNLSLAQVSDFQIPVPSYSEQKRIVAILNESFIALEKAKENAEKNLQNARELFESYLQSIFANPENDWEEKNLGDICEVIAGQSPEGKYYNNSGKGLPFYQGKKEFTEKYLGAPTTWTTNITKEAQEGDILMSVRAPVGPVNFSTSKICIGRGLAAIRASKHIDKEFLFSFLIKHKNEIVGNAGAVFNSISKTQIENILIPLPSISKQKIIVDKLITLSTETKRLEIVYQQKLADLEELKKSVLHKAFTGELAGACS